MYFVKTPTLGEQNPELLLRQQIEKERKELYDALRSAGMKDPPVEQQADASQPRPDCIFFEYRDGLKQDSYDARTFAEAFVSYSWDSIEKVKAEAAREFSRCSV